MKNYLLTAFILATSVSHAQFIDSDPQGQKFTNNIPLANGGTVFYSVPLPAGEWTAVRGNTYTTSSTNSKMQEMVISNIENKKLNMSVYINAHVDGNSARWLDEPCKGEDFIYKNDYGMKLWDQRCTTLKLGSYLQKSDNKVQQISRDFYAKEGIKHDYNNLQLTYTQYTRSGKYLVVQFYIFPSNYGFENPTADVLVTHPWYLSNYKNDPSKVKFVNELTTWAENYSNVLFTNFTESKTQKVVIPAFEYKK
jgi:hypothetical protein